MLLENLLDLARPLAISSPCPCPASKRPQPQALSVGRSRSLAALSGDCHVKTQAFNCLGVRKYRGRRRIGCIGRPGRHDRHGHLERERGPGPTLNGQAEGLPGNPVAGAVSSIAASPLNANTIFAGTGSTSSDAFEGSPGFARILGRWRPAAGAAGDGRRVVLRRRLPAHAPHRRRDPDPLRAECRALHRLHLSGSDWLSTLRRIRCQLARKASTSAASLSRRWSMLAMARVVPPFRNQLSGGWRPSAVHG